MIQPTPRFNLTREIADSCMRQRNRTKSNKVDLTVMVDGPGEGKFSLLPLRDAIDLGSGYTFA